MNLKITSKIIFSVFNFLVCSSCSKGKLPSTFYYNEIHPKELENLNIDYQKIAHTDKAFQLQVSQFDSDSAEISFIKWHPIYCPIDGILTQKDDIIYMNIGYRCDPNKDSYITEAAVLKFVWRLKLNNLSNYKFIPREAGHGQTWPIVIDK